MNKLNELLEYAKAKQQEFENLKGNTGSDALKVFSERNAAWEALRVAIGENLPVRYWTSEGRTDLIATTAAMTADTCLYFSNKQNATFCSHGIMLKHVCRLQHSPPPSS